MNEQHSNLSKAFSKWSRPKFATNASNLPF